MKNLLVYADFDWLKEIELVGELSYESLRGSDNYSFTFEDAWLKRYGDLFLSADLNNYPGRQYTQPGSDLFGCFSDTLPDRWGRMLINSREQSMAKEEKRPIRPLTSFDYLTGIDDFSRMGGFRFKESPDGDFINSNKMLRIPPLTDVHDLIRASREIERSEEANQLPDMRWIAQLVHPGSSLGGARPNAREINNYKVFKLTDYHEAYEKADIVAFLVAHDPFKTLPWREDTIILDFCGIFKKN